MSNTYMLLRFSGILFLTLLAMPAALQAQEVETIAQPGQGAFTVPGRVYELTVEAWGAGGSGEGSNRGGGGGGAYSRQILEVNPGTIFTYQVGGGAPSGSNSPGGDSWFGNRSLVLAKGGSSATGLAGALGGAAQGGVGSVRYRGGNGADGVRFSLFPRGGGGGSSAGFAASGTDASAGQGGDAPAAGGDGGDEGGTVFFFFGGNGEPGELPGGGGGGGGAFGSGGAGGDGRIRLSYQALPLPQCSAIFDPSDGIREEVPPEERLDLSVFEPRNAQSWPSNNVIPAGNHVYQGQTFGNNVNGFTVDGSSRVLVDGNLTINSTNFGMNADGAAGDLVLIVDGDLVISRPNVNINAVIYVTGNVSFGNNLVIVGALALEGLILDRANNEDPVTYNPSAVANADFGGACLQDETPSLELDHIRVVHPGAGLTCQAANVEVLACADPECSILYPDPVSLSLQPAGWLPSQSVSLTGSADLQFQRSSQETVTIGVNGASPVPESGVQCIAPDGSGSCDISFRDSGFVLNLPDLVAGEVNSFSIAALETNEETRECAALFAGETRTIEFGTNYLIPDPGNRAETFSTVINGTPVASDGVSLTGVEVTFDENGVADGVSIRYDDAGQNSLRARYVDANQPDGGVLVIDGASDYVSTPYGLCLIPEAQCDDASLACAEKHVAGTSFDVTPKAYRYGTGVDELSCANKPGAPSFARNNVQVNHSILFPEDGQPGNILESDVNYGDGIQSLTVTEVGVFSIQTEAVTGGYLGRDIPASDPSTTARMIPARLDAGVEEHGIVDSVTECSGFAYTGQPFGWQRDFNPVVRVEAWNGSEPPALTANYTHEDVLVQLPAGRFRVEVPDTDGTATWEDEAGSPVPFQTELSGALLSTGVIEELSPGVARYVLQPDEQFLYPKSSNSRIVPFQPDLEFLLQPLSDRDDIPVQGILAGGLALTPEPAAGFEIRYGRFELENVYGPETGEPLLMPFRVTYWDDGRFVTNIDDGCSPWSTNDVAVSDPDGVMDELAALSGDFELGTTAPLALVPSGNRGQSVLEWDVPIWLKGDWNQDETLVNPTATATFGVYRGNDRIIYWREVPAN